MLSNYFKLKTDSSEFKKRLNILLQELNGKKVLIYGAGEGFEALNRTYDFKTKLNIVGIADKKFETKPINDFLGIKTVIPKDITNEEYDIILVTNEHYKPIIKFLTIELNIPTEKVKTAFEEEIKDERVNLNYLYANKFDKTLPKLIKKLKNKKIVFYGAGVFLELIQKYFDISELNVIAIADKKYEIYRSEDTVFGYKTCAPTDIIKLKPDYVIVATKMYIGIVEDLYYNILKDSKIKIKPLLKKSLITLIKEIWNM